MENLNILQIDDFNIDDFNLNYMNKLIKIF